MALLRSLQFAVLILFLALHAVNADITTFDLLDLLTSEKNGMYLFAHFHHSKYSHLSFQ